MSLATPSIAVLTSRVTGMVTGSIVSPLCGEFVGDQLRRRFGRQHEHGLPGVLHRLAVEMDGEAAVAAARP